MHLLAGAIAATVSNTIVAPLDVIRLNIMVSETPLSALTPTLTLTLIMVSETGLGLGSPGQHHGQRDAALETGLGVGSPG